VVFASSGAASATNVAYIALPPGAVPNGVTTTIRNQVTGSAIVVPMVAGGFDPVPLEAAPGDLLALEIERAPSKTGPRVRQTSLRFLIDN
jgi:hypothetical protein